MIQPKFSVIVPVFNAEKYIEKCLDSLFKQTLYELEIIVVNDGSTDDTFELLNTLAKNETRLKVVTQPNSGPSVARNVGISNSTGAYISFVDADDWLEKNAYELLEKEIKENYQPDIVMFNTFTNNTVKNNPFLKSGCYQKEDIKKFIYPRLIESLNVTNGSAIRASVWLRVFKRDLIFDKIEFETSLRNNEDLVFCFLAAVNAKTFLYLGNSYLYHNCLTTGSISRGYMQDSFNKMKPLFGILTGIAKKHNEYDFNEQIKARVFRTFVYCCENEFLPDNKKTFIEKFRYIKQLVYKELFMQYLINWQSSNEKAKKMYMFCFKNKLVLPIMILANYRVKKRIKRLQYV